MSSCDFYTEHLNAGLAGCRTWLARGEDWETEVELELIDVSDFELPTGQLCACDQIYGFQFEDPDSAPYMKTFVERFSPGRYRFQVCVARYEPSDPRKHPQFEGYPQELLDKFFPPNQPLTRDERTALAIIRNDEAEVVRWELAEISELRDRFAPCTVIDDMPIDTGVIAYLDSSLASKLRTTGPTSVDQMEKLRGEIDSLYLANDRNTRSWAAYATEGNLHPNIMVCSTGEGSGGYPCYWGFDAVGNRSCLVTDFHCLYCLDL